MNSEVDVLIIGAGPTGLALAAELTRHGLNRVLIIDRLAEPKIQTKASVIWPRSLELLANYSGVVEAIEAKAIPIDKVAFYSSAGLIRRVLIGTHFRSAFDHAVLLEQWKTEKVLTDHVVKSGVSIRRSTELITLETLDKEQCVRVTLRSPVNNVGANATTTTTVHAKYVVGCDGGRSVVRKAIGAEFQGELLPGSFVALHFKSKDTPPDVNTELMLFLKDCGSSFMTRMPGDTWMAAIDLVGDQESDFFPPDAPKDERGLPKLLEEISLPLAQRLMNERLMPMEVEKVIFFSHFRINERLADKYGDGVRIFLSGDACHSHSPLGGQGMNVGMQDSINLGWKLAFVLKSLATPEILTTYETERREVGKSLIGLTTRSQKMASLRNMSAIKLRNSFIALMSAQAFFVKAVAGNLSELKVSYRGSSTLAAEHWTKPAIIPHIRIRRAQNVLRQFTPRVAAGDSCPTDLHLLPAGRRASNLLTGTPGFKLIIFQGRASHSVARRPLTRTELDTFAESSIVESDGVITDATVVPSDEDSMLPSNGAEERFGVLGQCFFLVRPDGHVAFRCEPVCLALLQSFLKDRLKCTSKKLVGAQVFRPLNGDWVHAVLVVGFIAAVGFAGFGVFQRSRF